MRKKLKAVLKAFIFGCFTFWAITLGIWGGAHVSMHGHGGEFWPELFFGLVLIAATPALLVQKVLGLEGTPLVNSNTFALLINGLLGGLLFVAPMAIWQFLKTVNDKKLDFNS